VFDVIRQMAYFLSNYLHSMHWLRSGKEKNSLHRSPRTLLFSGHFSIKILVQPFAYFNYEGKVRQYNFYLPKLAGISVAKMGSKFHGQSK